VTHNVVESDWKVFRELREVALQRFCKRVLEQLLSVIQDGSRNDHERYLAVFRLLQDRDRQLANAFDGPARSRMMAQLAAIHALGLLSTAELESFTEETRSVLDSLVKDPAT
jgi:hypothetical protein